MSAAVFRRTREMLPLLRLRGFDVSTADGRAKERMRRVLLTALASALAKGTSIATALISVPLTLHYLGAERYGMWMTMSAITAMLSFADFGIGNGVLTAVSQASGRDEQDGIRAYVSSAFAMLGMIALAILAVLAASYGLVDWFRVFNVATPLARAESGPAIAVFITCFALMLPLTVVQRVQLGLQMGFMSSLWQCVASLTALCGVLLAIWMQAGLPWLVAAYVGAPVLIALINSLIFFTRIRPDCAPRRASVSRIHGTDLARTGMLFFVLQIVVAIAYTSDSVLIAQKLGASAVASYAVPDRLFAMASMIVGLAVTPLWPAFGEALARGDKAWARRMLVRATLISAGIAASIGLIFVIAGPTLIRLWVGTSIVEVPFMLLVGFAVWRTIEASVGASSMYLNGMRAVRFQVVTAILTAAGAISAKLWLLPIYGIAVVPWATICVYLVTTALPMAIFLKRHA
ncbi:oligosaccharide flippase family protein [Sphingomonas sp. CJ99]